MPTPEPEQQLGAIVRTCQILIGALVVGPLLFLAIAAVVGPLMAPQGGAGPPAPGRPDDTFALIMTGTVLAIGALAVCMSFVLPRVLSANARKAALSRSVVPKTASGTGKGAKLQTSDEAQASLLPQFPSQLIVGAAILEGTAFFAAVAYFLVGGPILLAIAIVLIVVQLARFPTRARTELWLQQQREKLRDEEFAAGSKP